MSADRYTGILSMGSGASSDLHPLKVESVNPVYRSMIRRRRADSVRTAAAVCRKKKKIFRKKSKIFLSIFHPLWRISHLPSIERDTEPLRCEKMSKFFHRLLRFDSPALCLTKAS